MFDTVPDISRRKHPVRGVSGLCGPLARENTASFAGALFVETILVLEDEPFVKNPICAILRACGYRVLDAATAAEAIEVNPPHGERISLLIADVFLPDKSGVWAAVKLLDMCPTIRILFVSGTPIESWPSQDFSAL